MLSTFFESGLGSAVGRSGTNRDTALQLIEGVSLVDGRFAQVQRIGSSGGDGTFSLMFSTTDITTGRAVALKVYHPSNPQLDDGYRRASFDREAEILERLGRVGKMVPLADETTWTD